MVELYGRLRDVFQYPATEFITVEILISWINSGLVRNLRQFNFIRVIMVVNIGPDGQLAGRAADWLCDQLFLLFVYRTSRSNLQIETRSSGVHPLQNKDIDITNIISCKTFVTKCILKISTPSIREFDKKYWGLTSGPWQDSLPP